jgi:hypothetical protein
MFNEALVTGAAGYVIDVLRQTPLAVLAVLLLPSGLGAVLRSIAGFLGALLLGLLAAILMAEFPGQKGLLGVGCAWLGGLIWAGTLGWGRHKRRYQEQRLEALQTELAGFQHQVERESLWRAHHADMKPKLDLLQSWGPAEKSLWPGPDQAASPNGSATKVA